MRYEKKKFKTAFLFTIFALILTSTNISIAQTNETGTFTDPRDGKVYATVKIGEQWLMSENLAFKPESGNYWAYDNNPLNLALYGYLYDWETAKNIAPPGWHLPSAADFKALKKSLGGKRDVYKKLGGTMEKVYAQMIEGGESGFNAKLGGIRLVNGEYTAMGSHTHFWSSSESKMGQWFYILNGKIDGKKASILDSSEGIASLANQQDNAIGGKSVRLFKD